LGEFWTARSSSNAGRRPRSCRVAAKTLREADSVTVTIARHGGGAAVLAGDSEYDAVVRHLRSL